jgi:RHS repeat-associated protein
MSVTTLEANVMVTSASPRAPSAYDNPYFFTARRLDAATGLYYYRNRYYDPRTGRFLSRDPAHYVSTGNLYDYVENDPTNVRDPLGLEGEPASGGGNPTSTVPRRPLFPRPRTGSDGTAADAPQPPGPDCCFLRTRTEEKEVKEELGSEHFFFVYYIPYAEEFFQTTKELETYVRGRSELKLSPKPYGKDPGLIPIPIIQEWKNDGGIRITSRSTKGFINRFVYVEQRMRMLELTLLRVSTWQREILVWDCKGKIVEQVGEWVPKADGNVSYRLRRTISEALLGRYGIQTFSGFSHSDLPQDTAMPREFRPDLHIPAEKPWQRK